jgi:hypothetical protein
MGQKTDAVAGINNASLGLKGRALIFLAVLVALGVTVFGQFLYALGAAVLHRYGSSQGLLCPLFLLIFFG